MANSCKIKRERERERRQIKSLTMGLHSFLVFSSGNGLKCWAALQTDPGQDRVETLSKDKEGRLNIRLLICLLQIMFL